MENASKALIIAGEILIGVLILSLASYIIVQFGNFSRNMNDQISETEVRSFNVRFTNFSGRANISMQEVASMINYAKQRNASLEAEPGDEYYIDVKVGGSSVLDQSINEFLEENKNNTYYSCNANIGSISVQKDEDEVIESASASITFTDTDITYNETTKMVNSINFNEISNEDYANALLQGVTIELNYN